MAEYSVPPSRPFVARYVAGLTFITLVTLALWPGVAKSLFDDRTFMPHVFCYRGNPPLVWTHAITDLLIGCSYVVISAVLTWLVHRARRDIPFSWVFLAFGLFIVACGATHFMEVLTLWRAKYWLSAAVKIVTAVASVATAIVLPPLVPRTLQIIRDAKISEARRVELQERFEALQRERAARAEAEEANRAKDAFLAMISHELRTPMTSILGWSTMLNDDLLDAELSRTGLAAIVQSARVQAQLIDDLLDVSRIVTGKLALDPRRIDLAVVVRSAIEGIVPAAEEKNLRLEQVLSAPSVPITGDAARLRQVVMNLLTNAVKFTSEGGRVRIALETDRDRASIVVSDTGIGIDQTFLPRVFDRFAQADDSITRTYGGLGLGLAIAKYLVELHGGSIEADSDGPGSGATFIVRLPVHAHVDVPEHTPAPPPAAAELAGARVLLVDDDDAARQMMHVAIAHAGATVVDAPSAGDALRALRFATFDVVVTDIAMPGQDGFALLADLRRNGYNGRVIAISALAAAVEKSRIQTEAFDRFLQKPVDPKRLTLAIAEVMGTIARP